MRFLLVNDRKLQDSFCVLCCEPIETTYLRDLETRLSYCGTGCYRGYRAMSGFAWRSIPGERDTRISDRGDHSVRGLAVDQLKPKTIAFIDQPSDD